MKPVEPPRDSHENQLQPCHEHAHAPSAVRLAQPTAVRCCEGCGAEALRGGLKAIIEADWSWHVLITCPLFLLILQCSSVLVIVICEVSGFVLMLSLSWCWWWWCWWWWWWWWLMLLRFLDPKKHYFHTLLSISFKYIDTVELPPGRLKNGPVLSSRWPVTAHWVEWAVAASVTFFELGKNWRRSGCETKTQTPLGYTWLRSSS